MLSEDEARVRVASSLLLDVIDELRHEGYGPDVLHLALVDAGVRLGRFYTPKQPTAVLLRRISSLAFAMAKDEEAERKGRSEH